MLCFLGGGYYPGDFDRCFQMSPEVIILYLKRDNFQV